MLRVSRVFRTPACFALLVLLTTRDASAQGYAREEAAGRMTVADGLEAKLFAAEPEVRQPILVKMDDRGRLWTIQYLQYPNPAGLERVQVDRWSRTVYDRIPKPPPHGPRGADKITILTDTDGDGVADEAKDFVDGLNLATGLEFGYGGVFVIQVPYLLFYPDRNRDDVPDADPEVLLEGFGMEDAQSFANHLTWGPDGWLYGLNGSTTTCNIRGVEFQQGCWRYHPVTKAFELFCEGGGNLFGLTFDERGNLFYSSNGGLFYHAVQGAVYEKNFGKHGPLHNPYAYGYFQHVKNSGVRGTPTTGGTIYLGDSFPQKYRGAFLCGNFLGHSCSWWNVTPRQSTVEANLGGMLADSHDTWFGPTDLCLGADGSIYVSDFHDRRTAHPDPDAEWDRSNGRIFKIQTPDTKPIIELDLARKSSGELIELLSHRNQWYAARARVELAHRRDGAMVPRLQQLAVQEHDPQLALQALWALHVSAGLDEPTSLRLLDHSSPDVRAWTVRLLGDAREVSINISDRLAALARSESSSTVRLQLAATAKRLAADDAVPIIANLLKHKDDADDLRIPLQLWWAIESKAVSDRAATLDLFTTPETWQGRMSRDNAVRLVRRYAAEGTVAGYEACLRLIQTAPQNQLAEVHEALAKGLSERAGGLAGIGHGGLFQQFGTSNASEPSVEQREFVPVTKQLKSYVATYWQQDRAAFFRLTLALRCEVDGAYEFLKSVARDPGTKSDERIAAIELITKFGGDDCIALLLSLLDESYPDEVRGAAMTALKRFDAPEISEQLIRRYPALPSPLQRKARELFLARPATTRGFLELVEQQVVAPKDVPVDELRVVALHQDEALLALVEKYWGKISAGTPEEKLATMRRYANDLRAGTGDMANGAIVFEKNCAVCHRLFEKGAKIGPDLTSTTRKDTAALLANIVDPNAVIRRDYLNSVVVTTSGQVVSGLVTSRDAASLTLADTKGKLTVLARDEIDELRTSPVSLMPEQLLNKLTPRELRDLFRYLQSDGP